MPTFEEFYKEVRKCFKDFWKTLSEEEADKYIDSEIDFIKRSYLENVEEYQNGEITLEQFRRGAVASVAHCLEMMY